MNINFHGAEAVGLLNGDQVKAVDLKDRDGNRLSLFFDSPEALQQLRDALAELAIDSEVTK